MWPFSKKKVPKKVITKEEKTAQIKEEAMANMRKARADIGEETLDKVAKAIEKMERDKKMEIVEQTKRKLDNMDNKEVASHVRSMMND